MSNRLQSAAGLLLVAGALSAPAGLAAYLVKTATGPARPPSLLLAQATGGSSAENTGGSVQEVPGVSLLTGVLFSSGGVEVDWNGVKTEMSKGSSYAYLGGEQLSVDESGMGMLALGDGNQVFFCPGSQAKVSIDSNGSTKVEIVSGGTFLNFAAGKPFMAQVSGRTIGPMGGASANSGKAVTLEVVAQPDGSVLICDHSGQAGVDSGSGAGMTKAVADITTVGSSGGNTGYSLPADAKNKIAGGNPANGGQGSTYLCRCPELAQYAASHQPAPANDEASIIGQAANGEGLVIVQAASGEGKPAEQAANGEGSATTDARVGDDFGSEPNSEFLLDSTRETSTFDPNLLGATGAGPDSSQTDLVSVAAIEFTPPAGGGGGNLATPE